MNARGVLPELELAAGSLFVADLHLDAGDAEAVRPFTAWAAGLSGVPALVVLGDLFDVWVGTAQAEMPGAALVLAALAALRARGTRVIVVPGNRDFLLGKGFERLSGAELFPEGFVARIPRAGAGRARLLCVHGDALCTRDLGYQRLRRVLRSRAVLALAPLLPRAAGLVIARRLRRASVRAIAAKLPDEKSIQPGAVLVAAREQEAEMVVCGHAHAFRDEALQDSGGSGPLVRWIVLDAFGGPRDLLGIGVAGDGTVHSSAGRVR